jgi:DNA-binding CsgD family transcriptional regulator
LASGIPAIRDPATLPVDPIACAELMQAPGAEDFSNRLLELAAGMAAVEEIFAWAGQEGRPPEILAAASRHGDQGQRVKSYAGRFFRFDPLIEPGGPDGFFIRIVAADEIGFAEYRKICFMRPLFDHKISFVRRMAGQSTVLNFYLRQASSDPDGVLGGLTTLATVALACLHRRSMNHEAGIDGAADRMAERLRARLGQLSPMEARVLAHLALARSPGKIAGLLGIKSTTIKTYRARALNKCGCREVAEVLALLVD